MPAAHPGRSTFAVLLVGSAVLLAAVLLPLWKPLFFAVVLAGALKGVHDRLTRRMRGRRRGAAGVLLAGVILLVLIPLGLLATFLVRQAIELGTSGVRLLQARGIEGLVALAPDRLEPVLRERLASLSGSWSALAGKLAAQSAALAGALGAALSRTGTLLFQLAMMLVAFFFLLADGPALMRWLRDVSPLGARLTAELFDELRRTGTSVLSSTVATAAVQSAVATVGYVIARVPAPLVFGFVTFVAAFIPSVGTAVVAVPIGVVLLVAGHFVAGGFLLAWSLLVTGTIDNVLKPVLARGGVGLHGAVVFFAMIGGILAFGGLGLILGPIAVSLFVALVRMARRELDARAEEVEPEHEREPMQPN